jgi:hypothetical protein
MQASCQSVRGVHVADLIDLFLRDVEPLAAVDEDLGQFR